MKKQKYDWKKTAKKVLWSLAEIVVIGSIAFATERPELLVIVPMLEGAKNYIKHRNL